MADPTAHFYSQPSYIGAGFPVFSGSRRQRGGNILGSLSKLILPALKAAGRAFLHRGSREAIGLAGDAGIAALSGRGKAGVMQTLRNRGLKRLSNAGKAAFGSAYNTYHRQHLSSPPKMPRQRPLPPPPPLPRPPMLKTTPLPRPPTLTAQRSTSSLGKRKHGLPIRTTAVKRRRRRGGGGTAIANF